MISSVHVYATVFNSYPHQADESTSAQALDRNNRACYCDGYTTHLFSCLYPDVKDRIAILTPLRQSLALVSHFFNDQENTILYPTIMVADYSMFGPLRECLELDAHGVMTSPIVTINADFIKHIHLKCGDAGPRAWGSPSSISLFTFRQLRIFTTAWKVCLRELGHRFSGGFLSSTLL